MPKQARKLRTPRHSTLYVTNEQRVRYQALRDELGLAPRVFFDRLLELAAQHRDELLQLSGVRASA